MRNVYDRFACLQPTDMRPVTVVLGLYPFTESRAMTKRFRVWDGEEIHEPPHGFLLGAEGMVYRCSSQVGSSERAVVGEPMFYTGLNDSEGTPIYEGGHS